MIARAIKFAGTPAAFAIASAGVAGATPQVALAAPAFASVFLSGPGISETIVPATDVEAVVSTAAQEAIRNCKFVDFDSRALMRAAESKGVFRKFVNMNASKDYSPSRVNGEGFSLLEVKAGRALGGEVDVQVADGESAASPAIGPHRYIYCNVTFHPAAPGTGLQLAQEVYGDGLTARTSRQSDGPLGASTIWILSESSSRKEVLEIRRLADSYFVGHSMTEVEGR